MLRKHLESERSAKNKESENHKRNTLFKVRRMTEKIGFHFDGRRLKVRSEEKGNLLETTDTLLAIQTKTNDKLNKHKSKANVRVPTVTVETTKVVEKEKPKTKASIFRFKSAKTEETQPNESEQIEVEFSERVDLSQNFSAVPGSTLLYEGRTFQALSFVSEDPRRENSRSEMSFHVHSQKKGKEEKEKLCANESHSFSDSQNCLCVFPQNNVRNEGNAKCYSARRSSVKKVTENVLRKRCSVSVINEHLHRVLFTEKAEQNKQFEEESEHNRNDGNDGNEGNDGKGNNSFVCEKDRTKGTL